ncbi:MAG: hypothetical protein OXC14_19725 [Rhodospirillaceae bacterium]|nr:hypothetical protein [Rhodospirillaceae bacterium]
MLREETSEQGEASFRLFDLQKADCTEHIGAFYAVKLAEFRAAPHGFRMSGPNASQRRVMWDDFSIAVAALYVNMFLT